jgi:uncharacterized membrane protein
MFLNVWLVIWPNQQIVIASANQAAQGGQPLPAAAGAGRRAGLTSRTNTVFSFPMLFFMGASTHYSFGLPTAGSAWAVIIISLVILALVEVNALIGTQGATKKPLDSVSGAIWSGVILTAVYYIVFVLFV